jgi:futalosine hydrolase
LTGYGKEKKIGVLCSVDLECREIAKRLRRKTSSRAGNAHFLSGVFEGGPVVIAVSGIGKVNAAHGSTLLIENYNPWCIINVGIAGCYPGQGMRPGDVAVALKEVYADEGVVTRQGFLDMQEIGIPVMKRGRKTFYNEFPADSTLLRKFRSVEKKLSFEVRYGKFLTVSSVTGTIQKAKELENAFDGICESMEGAAVFHISRIYGIPCFEIRGISNIIEDRDRNAWAVEKAARAAQDVAASFIANL